MAPPGKTILVMEYFSFRDDMIWTMPDEELAKLTVDNLELLKYLSRQEVLDSLVVRVPKAYPLFKVGYRDYVEIIHDYLERFENLHISGRSGMLRYYNMDVAIRSGIETAEKVLGKFRDRDTADREAFALINT